MSDTVEHSGLYLLVPTNCGPGMVRDLSEVLGAFEVSCVLLRQSVDMSTEPETERGLVEAAHKRDVAVLIENDVQKAQALGADGVHLSAFGEDPIDAYKAARSALGDNKNIGCHAGFSRHDAMIFGEAGADYISFGGVPNVDAGDSDSEDSLVGLIEWWGELFQPASVAWDVQSADVAAQLARAGADFVSVGTPIWGHEAGVIEASKAFNKALRTS